MLLSLQNFQVNNRIIRILLVALLIFAMVFCAFMFQLETAHASVLAGTAATIIASLLLSVGFSYSTPVEWDAVVDSYSNFVDDVAMSDIYSIASAFMDFNKPGNFLFNVTPAILSSLTSWIQKYWNSESDSIIIQGSGLTLGGIDCSYLPVLSNQEFTTMSTEQRKEKALSLAYCRQLGLSDKGESVGQIPVFGDFIGVDDYKDYSFHILYYGNTLAVGGRKPGFVGNLGSTISPGGNWSYVSHVILVSSPDIYKLWGWSTTSGGKWTFISFGNVTSTSFPTTESKPNTTYFPSGVTSGNPSTTFPSNTASKPLTTDSPLTVPESGINSGTTVGDVRPDVDENKGTVIGWLTKIWNAIQSIPGAIASAISAFFTPPVGLWDGFINDAVKVMSPPSSVDFTDYVKSISIPDVTGTFKGKTLTFVDNQKLRDNVAVWRQYIGAFLAFLIVIYNYNMFMKLLGYSGITLTDSGRVRHEPVDINNLSGAGPSLPPPKGGK